MSIVFQRWNGTEWVTESEGGGSGVSNHASLTNLSYANSGHTGFSPAKYTTTFTNADLSSSILTITHSLDTTTPLVAVYDSSNIQQTPQVTVTDNNTLTIDFTGYGTLTGTWRVAVL